MSPFFSIIVPVYNVKQYLNECLDSILYQTFSDFELIIVDDGSTDGCSTIIDQYADADHRVTAIHQSNQGLFYSRRVGIAKSKGKYIVHVDSDDACEKEMLSTLHKIIRDGNPELVVYNYMLIDENSDVVKLCEPVFDNGIVAKEEFLTAFFSSVRLNNIWIKCAKKDIIDQIIDYESYKQIKMGEDIVHSIPLVLNSKSIAYSQECLYKYRINRNGMSRKLDKSVIYSFLMVRELLYKYVWNSFPNKVKKQFSSQYFRYLGSYLFKLTSIYESKKEYVHLWYDIRRMEIHQEMLKYYHDVTLRNKLLYAISTPRYFNVNRIICKLLRK